MTCLVPAEAGLSILTLRFSLERILGGSLLIRIWGCQTLRGGGSVEEDIGASCAPSAWGSTSPGAHLQSLSLQPFRCAHCHYSCNISGSLKRHYNRKHPNEEYANVGTGELAADALVQQGRRCAP